MTAGLIVGLEELGRRIRKDFEILAHPRRPWVLPAFHPEGRHVHDVVIVGAGHTGLGIALALRRAYITNILVVDARPEGREGPWLTYARMDRLRTAKDLIGPDGDLPNLTFQAWYEAQHGETAWRALDLIPREAWMDYLRWFRGTLNLPVENETRVLSILPDGRFLRLGVERKGAPDVLIARKVVLATGFEGGGGANVPEALVKALPRRLWAHSTDDDIDLTRIRGGRVGVIGAGASAFDMAIWALEQGASEVHLFVRRTALPAVNSMRGVEYTGFFRHFGDLDDLARWRYMRHFFSLAVPPPPATLERALGMRGFHLHLGCPVLSTCAVRDIVEAETPEGTFSLSLLIFGTGFAMELRRRPELSAAIDHIALWRDRLMPPPTEESDVLAAQPYLGPAFELVEKHPGEAPWIRNIRFVAVSSWVSMGPSVVGLNGMKFGLPRLVDGLCRDLFVEDAERHFHIYQEGTRSPGS